MKNLKTKSFSININANREQTWNALWEPENYKKWSAVFNEGSHYKGELKQGNTILFLGDGECGMSSYIEKLVENEQMAFAHQKEIKNGLEIVSTWQGAKEIYYLKKENHITTELQVIIDLTPDMEGWFNEVFPKALLFIKKIAEHNNNIGDNN